MEYGTKLKAAEGSMLGLAVILAIAGLALLYNSFQKAKI